MPIKGESGLRENLPPRPPTRERTTDVTSHQRFFHSPLRRFAAAAVVAVMMAGALVASSPSAAQWATGTTGAEYRPRLSTAEEIAITQHVLSADAPDPAEWAKYTKEYQASNDFDRQKVLEEKRKEYIQKFKLYIKPDALVVRARVQLSPYSELNKGFIIESFTNETFFAYSFAGQNYALVIPKLMDYQWIGIEKQDAELIINALSSQSKKINVVIEVEPKFADKTPIELQGKKYRLLGGEVVSISLYGSHSDRVLWSRNGIGRAEKSRNSIINLQQGKK